MIIVKPGGEVLLLYSFWLATNHGIYHLVFVYIVVLISTGESEPEQ